MLETGFYRIPGDSGGEVEADNCRQKRRAPAGFQQFLAEGVFLWDFACYIKFGRYCYNVVNWFLEHNPIGFDLYDKPECPDAETPENTFFAH